MLICGIFFLGCSKDQRSPLNTLLFLKMASCQESILELLHSNCVQDSMVCMYVCMHSKQVMKEVVRVTYVHSSAILCTCT